MTITTITIFTGVLPAPGRLGLGIFLPTGLPVGLSFPSPLPIGHPRYPFRAPVACETECAGSTDDYDDDDDDGDDDDDDDDDGASVVFVNC